MMKSQCSAVQCSAVQCIAFQERLSKVCVSTVRTVRATEAHGQTNICRFECWPIISAIPCYTDYFTNTTYGQQEEEEEVEVEEEEVEEERERKKRRRKKKRMRMRTSKEKRRRKRDRKEIE